MKAEPSQILQTANHAACLAGRFARDKMNIAEASIKNGTTGEELVTQIDRQAQKIIMDRIRQDFPDNGFIAEEGEQETITKIPPQADESIWWVIDPIDGTNNYAHGVGLYAVSIAVMTENGPIAGAIYHPDTDTLFCAAQGGPALCNDKPIHTGTEPLNAFASVGLDSHFGNIVPYCYIDIMLKTRFRNLGSTALHMAYVADGGMLATIICTPKLWDIAAGAVIAEAAGARVTDWHGNPLWPMNLEAYQGQRIPSLVANPVAHQEILEMMKGERLDA
jgi:myo-inositol-1(or 4)-monophosphatase